MAFGRKDEGSAGQGNCTEIVWLFLVLWPGLGGAAEASHTPAPALGVRGGLHHDVPGFAAPTRGYDPTPLRGSGSQSNSRGLGLCCTLRRRSRL